MLLTKQASDLKYRVKPEHKAYANDDDLQLIADYKKTPIVLYNNVYEKMDVVYTPARNLNRERIEIKLEAHHYSAMIRWHDIDEC